jgi:hypothetical protein
VRRRRLPLTLRAAGLAGQRMEVAELDRAKHPYFWCCQYHPEFQSFPHAPSPPFWALVCAAAKVMHGALPFPLDTERGVFPKKSDTPPSTPSRSPFPSPLKVPFASLDGDAALPPIDEFKDLKITPASATKRKFED